MGFRCVIIGHRQTGPPGGIGFGPADRHPAHFLAAILFFLILAGCSAADPPEYDNTPRDDTQTAATVPVLSDTARAGEQVFNANCALCHGMNAAGANQGPPLVHQVYEPAHHQDFAFRNAVRNGVPAHHWLFGDMPPVSGVSDDDVGRIICYVRELQLANGIIPDRSALTSC